MYQNAGKQTGGRGLEQAESAAGGLVSVGVRKRKRHGGGTAREGERFQRREWTDWIPKGSGGMDNITTHLQNAQVVATYL